MSNIPPPKSFNNKPIPKEAIKFLKVSPSVKVMTLRKSSTTCRVKASQGGIPSNSLAGGSGRSTAKKEEAEDRSVLMRLKPLPKERKMISVLSVKSEKKEEAKKQYLEKSGIGDERDTRKDVENIQTKSDPKEKRKHWYGRRIDALLSAIK